MTPAILPRFLNPSASDTLVRIGRDHDGGYLIDSRDIARSQALVSFGVNEDWSFEKQFCQGRDLPVFACDATLNWRYLVRRAWRSLMRLNPRAIYRSFSALLDYPVFFSGRRRHYRRYIGLDKVSGYTKLTAVLDEVRQESGVESGIFLKIDIEGWEYRIFDELIKHGHRFTGLAIELHDVDLHLDKLAQFIEQFPLNLVHVHANNYAPIDDEGIPLAIECTFSMSTPTGGPEAVRLPHPLDQPNKRNRAEIALSFR